LNVVAHQVQLMVSGSFAVCGVDAKLRGRQGKDEPPATGIDRREAEHVSKERPNSIRILSENQRMNPGDHVFTSAAILHDSEGRTFASLKDDRSQG
jgi:hypothetical protein